MARMVGSYVWYSSSPDATNAYCWKSVHISGNPKLGAEIRRVEEKSGALGLPLPRILSAIVDSLVRGIPT